jgi:dTDP-4-amino-4,6-dideoxygalactose transaminase
MKRSIPFLELATLHQSILGDLQDKIVEVIREGVFSAGKEVLLFEHNIKKYLDVPCAVSCSNGTDALEMALQALDIGRGDEVILPALTWVSTAEAVVNIGARPVFCEVDQDGLLDLSKAEPLINPNIKGIMPVHLYGKMVNMQKIMALAQNYGIKIVEDAAQAFGAFQEGQSAGSFGDIGCFSFYPTKNLGALGEAGLLTTHDPIIERRLRLILNHGQYERDVHELVGRNGKIDTLQAALLNIKLFHFDEWQMIRKKLAGMYLEQLQEIKDITLPRGLLNADHNAHLFTIRSSQRDELKTYLASQGIGTAIHYPNILPKTPAFADKGYFPMAELISGTTLSLPLHAHLLEEDVGYICKKIKDFFIR